MIESGFRYKFIFRFSSIGVAGLVFMALLLYYIVPKAEVRHYAEAIRSFIVANESLARTITLAIIVDSVVISVIVVLTAVFASHKIAGPIYRLRATLNDLLTAGKARPITLRSYDQVRGSATSLNDMVKSLDDAFRAVYDAQAEVDRGVAAAKAGQAGEEDIKRAVNELGASLRRFNV